MVATTNGKGKSYTTQQSLNNAIWSIWEVVRRSNCAGALQYVPELTWILFLRILDEREEQEAATAETLGILFAPSLDSPYRWRDWASRTSPTRKELFERGAFKDFVNSDLIPHLKGLKRNPAA